MNIKISRNEKNDISRFKNLKKDREKVIQSSFTDQIKWNYKSNELASILHPQEITVVIKEIKEENASTKTFVLEPKNTQEFPPYEAGQYIVLDVRLGDNLYKRAYSISSSPNDFSKYEITIKRVFGGLISNYLLDNAKEGDEYVIHGPFGNFTYQSLRDEKNILALCGGSGITPIMSMARAVSSGILDINLRILYGEDKEKDLIFKKELDRLAKKNKNIEVVYVLKEEGSETYENGLINQSLIEKYSYDNCSYFICGPVDFYHYLNDIFKKLDIPNKYIRHDIFKEMISDAKHIEHELTVLTDDKEIKIPCYEDETLVVSMEKGKINAPRKCLVGTCGFCRSKLISGEVKTDQTSLREADQNNDYIHPCVSYPLSDITIKLCK